MARHVWRPRRPRVGDLDPGGRPCRCRAFLAQVICRWAPRMVRRAIPRVRVLVVVGVCSWLEERREAGPGVRGSDALEQEDDAGGDERPFDDLAFRAGQPLINQGVVDAVDAVERRRKEEQDH